MSGKISKDDKLVCLRNVISKQDEYINLLQNEIDDLVKIASPNGWTSMRTLKGDYIRSQIEYYKGLIEK